MANFIFTVLPYLTLAVFLLGSALKVTAWWQTPVPLKIALPSAAGSVWDARLSLVVDALTFRPLWRQSKAYWLVNLVFHGSLLLVLLRHLRYFLDPVPGWLAALQMPGVAAGYLLPAALLCLIFRRLYVPVVIYVSTFADFFALLLLLSISLSGLATRLLFRVDVTAVKDLGLGLLRLHPEPLSAPGLFLYHFVLFLVLLLYFPFSKLTHGLSQWFSPTRNHGHLKANGPGVTGPVAAQGGEAEGPWQ